MTVCGQKIIISCYFCDLKLHLRFFFVLPKTRMLDFKDTFLKTGQIIQNFYFSSDKNHAKSLNLWTNKNKTLKKPIFAILSWNFIVRFLIWAFKFCFLTSNFTISMKKPFKHLLELSFEPEYCNLPFLSKRFLLQLSFDYAEGHNFNF